MKDNKKAGIFYLAMIILCTSCLFILSYKFKEFHSYSAFSGYILGATCGMLAMQIKSEFRKNNDT